MYTDLLVPRGLRAHRTAKKAPNESPIRGSIFAAALFAICLIIGHMSSARAEYIYYGGFQGDTFRTNLDGDITTHERFSHFLANPWTLTADPLAGKLYAVSRIGGWVNRGNLDGTTPETLPVSNASGIAVDGASDTLYWTQDDEIWSWQMDKPFNFLFKHQLIDTGGSKIEKLAMDLAGGKLYWTDRDGISRANLDGTGMEPLVTGLTDAVGIALDIAGGKMYWSHSGSDGLAIVRSNLDGTDQATILSHLSSFDGIITGIALDLELGKIYWTDSWLMRANLDGSGAEIVAGHAGEFSWGLFIVPEPSSLVLGALGLIAIATWGWRRKRCSA